MTIAEGSRLGPYVIQATTGDKAGEVYTAFDTRVDRTVVIRVLPSDDPGLNQRLKSEAKILAGIRHPNIRVLHDIGRERIRVDEAPDLHGGHADVDAPSAGGEAGAAPEEREVEFLVLEHLEGETVADRLARGPGSSASKRKPPITMDDALAIAVQIAGALDHAHQKGLVHGHLRPDTILLTRGGKSSDPPVVKLLDFGLAPEDGPAEAGHYVQESLLPTREHVTAQGTVAAQVEYLAPEQLEGKPADARSDLFALGVVLYEMLTGRKAFEGKSPSVLMAAILTAEPDPLPAAHRLVSPALDHVLKRCLAKDPEDRWQTAHDLLVQLRWIAGSDASASGAAAVGARRARWILYAALTAAVVMLAALAGPIVRYLQGPTDQPPFQFRNPVVGLLARDISISPDGRMMAFMARPDQQQPASLFVRPVGSLDSRRIAGTDDAAQPFWSPDSRYIGFVAGGKLRKVETVGGPPRDVADAPDFEGGTWNEAGTILFGSAKGVFSVSAEGGTPMLVSTASKPETGHFWPHFLPDGRHYIYQAWSEERTNRSLFTGSVDSKDRVRLMAAETNVVYVGARSGGAPGHLLFHREATVFAQPFDAGSRSLAGDAVQIAGGVAYDQGNGRGYFDVSQGDALVYFQGAAGGGGRGFTAGRGGVNQNVQLAWVSRTGQLIAAAGDPAPQGDFDVSPDGSLVAVTRQEESGADVWLIDWRRGGIGSRLTMDPADDINPVWLDQSRVAFTSYRKGNADIYVKNANSLGDDVALLESPANEFVEASSHDGRYVAYLTGQDNFLEIYALPLFGDRKPIPVVTGRYQKNEPQFSFDGKWLAYTSDESKPGSFEVYVMSFPPKDPATDQKLRVSRGGGGQPRWSKDGRELYYRALDNQIMVVGITAGAKITAEVQRLLFPPFLSALQTRDPARHQLAVTPDGDRFLLRVPPGQVAREGGSGAARAGLVFDPATGQVSGGARRGGRARGAVAGAPGLTVIRNWAAIAQRTGR
ncbi:MAG TPA: protein kinase [Vicinamibacterales bacterium]|nr:protein kinase [Vicinamibacterales bacterium]